MQSFYYYWSHIFLSIFFFFFNDTATTEIYTLSLHDALPIQRDGRGLADSLLRRPAGHVPERRRPGRDPPARQPVLGRAVHRAGRDLPPAERHRPSCGPH